MSRPLSAALAEIIGTKGLTISQKLISIDAHPHTPGADVLHLRKAKRWRFTNSRKN
jgi:hypothetical protein